MAYITQYTSGLLSQLPRSIWARIAERWQRYTVYRRTYAELDALSSRELADMGISRSTISRLAREAAEGK